MGGDKPAGRFLVLKRHETRNTAVILPVICNARFARRRRGFRDTATLVAALYINSFLRPDFFAGEVVGHPDTRYLTGIVLLVMQRTAGAAREELPPTLQHNYRFVPRLDTPAADIALPVGKDEAAISEIASSCHDR